MMISKQARANLRHDLAVALIVVLVAAAALLAWVVVWGLSIMIRSGAV